MKETIRAVIARGVIPVADRLPKMRKVLRRIGIRASQDHFGARVVSIPTRGGEVFRLTHVDESYLAFQLFWKGADYYEPITRALLRELIRPGDTFLDIGAHVGFFSITTGLSLRGVKIIAFEPNPKNFTFLEANVAANRLSNIVCEPIAISDSDGGGTLYLAESDMSASLVKDFEAGDTKQIGSIEVRTDSLDGYLERIGLKCPMVIKVDIEGHEPAFFRGAAETIATYKPDIILEVLNEQDPELVSLLKFLGYHFYPITDEGLVELEAPKLVKRFPFLFFNHLLSVRPKQELARIFSGVREAIQTINLMETSKYFPKEQWPGLWQMEKMSLVPS